MAEQTLDCIGLSCPQPVIRCKQAIHDGADTILVIVDNEPARENVTRLLENQGFSVTVRHEAADHIVVNGVRKASEGCTEGCTDGCEVMSDAELAAAGTQEKQIITVFITADVIGAGDDALGAKLMLNFVKTLPEMGDELWRIVLVNGGVRLACEGNDSVGDMAALAEAGVDVLVCGTCLEHYGLLEAKRVGHTTNMLDVMTSLQLASKVIQI